MKKIISFTSLILMFSFFGCSIAPVIEESTYSEPETTEAPTVEEVVEEVPEPEEEIVILYQLTDDEFVQGLSIGASGGNLFGGNQYLGEPGSPTFTIVEHPETGNAIEVSSRAHDFYALDINFAPLDLSAGATYLFTAAGRTEAGTIMQFGRSDAPWTAYIQTTANASGDWSLEFTLTESDLLAHFLDEQSGMRIMTYNAASTEFIVDDITIKRIGPRGTAEVQIPEWDLTATSLFDAFSEFFLMGNIWSNASRMDAFNSNEGFLHHFNAVTAENNHKVDHLVSRTTPWQWNWTTGDDIVDWAEANELAMIGHTLVWHGQSPAWLTTVPNSSDPLTRAEAIENMHRYISTVASRYAGRIYSWDVLNEAIWGADQATWNDFPDWRYHLRGASSRTDVRPEGQAGLDFYSDSQWYNAFANGAMGDECGSDFIYYAFRFARIYDPFAILYYNDYNDHVPGKRDAIAQMVVEINDRWTQDPLYDGRLLIEGIGMQAHYSISGWMTNPRYVRSALELYISTGARIAITEWDITIGGSRNDPAVSTPELLVEQAERFALLMSWYLEFSDHIERISLWGLADHFSWISWGHPLLFDSNFDTKPAFYALLEAVENAEPSNISVPIVLTVEVPNGSPDEHFAYKLTAQQSNFAPIRWEVTNGQLPEGLRLIATTGVILGTPMESGDFTFTVSATNAEGSGTQALTVTILD